MAYAPRIQRSRRRPAFSLVELLVVMSIIAMLIGILLTTLTRARSSARSFVCKNQLKTIAFEFIQFADDFSHPNRGDSEKYGRRGFSIDDFQDWQYRLDEFWPNPNVNQVKYKSNELAMMCPAATGDLYGRRGLPCRGEAVLPTGNVSVAINMRLYQTSVETAGRQTLKPIVLSRRILERPMVPLAFDVDGQVAEERNVLPYYSAPPGPTHDCYSDGWFWFPSMRHREVNVCFVGGYVLSSPNPTSGGGWNWKYQPR